MIRRTWVPVRNSQTVFPDTITFYNFGDVWGELSNGEWTVYAIRARTARDGGVEETCERIDDEVPWGGGTVETYPCRRDGTTLEIPGWVVRAEGALSK